MLARVKLKGIDGGDIEEKIKKSVEFSKEIKKKCNI